MSNPWNGVERRRRPREQDSLSKLERVARETQQLSQEDVAQLHLIIEAYRSWQVLGKSAKWLVLFLAGISGFLIAIAQIREAFISWIK